MKGLMILANGFEDVEAIATIDVLKRAHVNLTLANLHSKNEVTTSANNRLVVETNLKEIDYTTYDFLVLPGGKAVFNELDKSKLVEEIVRHFCDNKKLVCAICAAPLLIGKHGYFKDLEYACFPGCNETITEGTLSNKPVVCSNNFITARSMYYTCDFALEIVSAVKGSERAIEIGRQIKGL